VAIKAEEIAQVAYLARIQVTEQHTESLTKDLNQILDFVDQMKSVDTSSIAPLGNPLEANQPLRADDVTEENEREALLSNAPATTDGLFLVPKVIE